MASDAPVAFFIPDFGGGGAERVQLAIIANLVERGYRVDLLLAHSGGSLLPLLPPQVRVIAFESRRLAATLWPLIRYLRSERPQALHAVMWPCTVIAVLARALSRSRCRLMLSDHIVLTRQYPGWRNRLALTATIRMAYRHADARIAPSYGAAADVARLAGLHHDAVVVVSNPLDLPEALTTSVEAEAAWRGANDRIVTLGSLKAQKNHALLLRAFEKVVEARPNARLLIVGEGGERPALERLRADLGLERAVDLIGFRTYPWPYLASAELFVLSSNYEGYANVVAEALHAGLRVVSTDCPAGPSEILDGGIYGRLVAVGDVAGLAEAMLQALEEPADPARQRARAQALSGASSIDRSIALLISS